MEAFGRIITAKIEKDGLNRQEIANALEVDKGTIYRLEKGQINNPSFRLVYGLMTYLKLDLKLLETYFKYSFTQSEISDEDKKDLPLEEPQSTIDRRYTAVLKKRIDMINTSNRSFSNSASEIMNILYNYQNELNALYYYVQESNRTSYLELKFSDSKFISSVNLLLNTDFIFAFKGNMVRFSTEIDLLTQSKLKSMLSENNNSPVDMINKL